MACMTEEMKFGIILLESVIKLFITYSYSTMTVVMSII